MCAPERKVSSFCLIFDNVDISNTNYAAITAGSRDDRADPNGPSCGTSSVDCNVGEFDMSEMTFNNVETAFSHGSGQGTKVTLSNFAVNNARDACFNFAQITAISLTRVKLLVLNTQDI